MVQEDIHYSIFFPFICNEFDLDIDIPYSNYIDKELGFCNLTDNQIIQLIESMIY